MRSRDRTIVVMTLLVAAFVAEFYRPHGGTGALLFLLFVVAMLLPERWFKSEANDDDESESAAQ